MSTALLVYILCRTKRFYDVTITLPQTAIKITVCFCFYLVFK